MNSAEMEQEDLKSLLDGDRVINREMRRKKPPTDNKYTKSTHKMNKLRSKNAKSKQQRKRDAAKARKARKENYTEVTEGQHS